MKDFFMKHINSLEPQDAIEIMCGKMYKIKEEVFKGVMPMEELRELSEMIDDFVSSAGSSGQSFKPREYYNPGQGQKENPYGPTGHIGYRPPIYPFFFPPFMDAGGTGQGQGYQPGELGQGGYRPQYPYGPWAQQQGGQGGNQGGGGQGQGGGNQGGQGGGQGGR